MSTALLLLVVALAALTAWFAPVASLLFAPLVFGVPHVATDLRVLFVDVSYPRRARLAIGGLLGLFLALAALQWIDLPSGLVSLILPVQLTLGLAAACATPLIVGGRTARVVSVAFFSAACVAAWGAPETARLIVVHGHNLVALGVAGYVVNTVGARQMRRVPTAALAVAAAAFLIVYLCLLLNVSVPPAIAATNWLETLGSDRSYAAAIPPFWQRGAVASFGFAQLVHLVVWGLLMPIFLGRNRSTTDMIAGRRMWAPIAIVGATTIGVYVSAYEDAYWTKQLYLQFAGFHAWVEIAFVGSAATSWLERRRLRIASA